MTNHVHCLPPYNALLSPENASETMGVTISLDLPLLALSLCLGFSKYFFTKTPITTTNRKTNVIDSDNFKRMSAKRKDQYVDILSCKYTGQRIFFI